MTSLLVSLVLAVPLVQDAKAIAQELPHAKAPEYGFRVLESDTKLRAKVPTRANKFGDFVFDNGSQSGYVLGSELFGFVPVASPRGNSPWKAFDINDEKTVLACFKSDTSHGLCLINGGTVRSIAMAPDPTIMGCDGFINNRGEFVFNAHVPVDVDTNGKSITAQFGFRFRGEKLTYLRYKETGAAQSAVRGLTDAGDAFGTISFGATGISSNSLSTLQLRPVVWTAKDELIELKLPPKCHSAMPTGMLDKDLVVGDVLSNTGKAIGVVWRKGEPTLIAIPGVDRTHVNLLPDGRIVAVGWTGSAHDGFIFENDKWRLLRELIADFPKDARIRAIVDVCSDGSFAAQVSRGMDLYSCFFKKKDREISRREK